METDPLLYLAIDNCFASKRWTRPQDWMGLVRDLGIDLVEASADTECDPLYMGQAYIIGWIEEVRRCSERLGVRVVNLYSGHGTYATLGLTHTDATVRARFLARWLKAHARTARALEAGMGFFAHAIPEPTLQDPRSYERSLEVLYSGLAELAGYAAQIGLASIGIEQMYSPHQPPWTIAGAKQLLASVYRAAGAPFYLTLDLGHMNGQQYFQKPGADQLAAWIERRAAGAPRERMWLGPRKAADLFQLAVSGKIPVGQAVAQIQEAWEGCDYLFAAPEDGSVHTWLRALAGYAPIIHLQQSDGKSSPHWPFSPEYNAKGIIRAEEVISSIARAYEIGPEAGLPSLCEAVVLTLEPFIGTAANPVDALEEIEQSIAYWRRFVPRNGMRLSEARSLCEK